MNTDQRNAIIAELQKAYAMELETVENYLAISIDLDGVRAEEIKKVLSKEVRAELGHARTLAKRIKVLEGRVPGSLELPRDQRYLQPPQDSTDVVNIIRGVIRAEEVAIAQYQHILESCNQIDWVTQDMAIHLLEDEQQHRRQFVGFLYEYERAEARRMAEAA